MPSTIESTGAEIRLKAMLQLQDGINNKINPQWMMAGNPWHRAIWTECAEMMDHVGWKWWKKQQPDMEQIHLELVDIFHFGLSDLIVKHGSTKEACDAAIASYREIEESAGVDHVAKDQVLGLIEDFASAALTRKAFSPSAFAELCHAVELGGDQLYRKYVGKNVLNSFRQDHGYKDGSYVKIWSGREDNDWLAEIGSRLQSAPENFASELYEALYSVYSRQTGAS
jgi:dimeric dUTPase (all-alpha-NTP-PPase superfamily)